MIVNPYSRNGATGRRWRGVEARLRDALGDLEVEPTRGPRDATRIAREGVRAGVERVVVAGGDGTLSEVVTGLLGAGLGSYAEIGLLPLGTGGDFARTLEIPRVVDAAVACVQAGAVRRVDAGRVTYRDARGEDVTSYYVNVASLGISGLVDQLANRTSKALGGRMSFLIATLRALARYANPSVTLRVDGKDFFEGPLVLAVAANGRYFGGGMHVAPEAHPEDGLLDVVVVPGLPKRQLFAKLPMIYRGTHLGDPAVLTGRGRLVEVESVATDVFLDVDGEPLGTLPARFEIVPEAVSVIGPAS